MLRGAVNRQFNRDALPAFLSNILLRDNNVDGEISDSYVT